MSSQEIIKANLFFVGAPRSGTTFLYDVFRRHPEVFVPAVKEPHFFCTDLYSDIATKRQGRKDREIQGAIHSDLIQDGSEYNDLFSAAGGYRWIAEFTPAYLASSDAACNIANYNPDAKIVAILRDPIERSLSHYRMDVGDGSVTEPFAATIARDPDTYLKPGLYCQQVQKFMGEFPPEQISLLRFEELVRDPAIFVETLCHDLDIAAPDKAAIESARTNSASRQPRNSKLTSWLRKRTLLLRLVDGISPNLVSGLSASLHKPLSQSAVDQATEAELRSFFRKDIEALEDLMSWNLAAWKS